ncbi:isoleucine--tRNA ligase, partial [Candidatus Gribaldobacteria bacterium]|nr:isoleucine--tRNA ligase [Candidatus Gribaldobacteria bacterium]
RTYKDMFQRYKALRGFDLRWQNGFDCQGLWVEVEVEKDLGFKTKKDIEEYGLEKFINRCKERVLKYSKIQQEQSIRLGQWADWENSYFTMSDENNFAIWHFLKKCYQLGLLYKGKDVVPWCYRCGTSISQHEILTEEYKEITHQAVYLKFPLLNEEKTSFLVWTTTPWTLPGNVALAVNPNLDYAKVRTAQGESYILLREKVNQFFTKEVEIVDTFSGKELAEIEFKGIFDEFPFVKNELGSFKHKVILWKDITEAEGTGVVHIATGCGQEDFALAKDNNLPILDISDQESKYRNSFGWLEGKEVYKQEQRDWIINRLKDKGFIFRTEDYKHRYPTCWRCKQELIFRLVDEWFIAMDKPFVKSKIKSQKSKIQIKDQKEKDSSSLREQLIESAKTIIWLPEFGLEREIDWLNNMRDWLISKKRYWGLALPIWQCQCGWIFVAGSKQELKERAVEGWQEFENKSPHRPQIDQVKIRCEKCGAEVERIKDVGTPWLDAGITPFSTISDNNRSNNIPYFNNQREEWQKWFPIEFIAESFPGQFKNWFYVLLVMSQVLEQKAPFKRVLGFASVVDEKGEEMHKSKGNAIWFDEAVEKISADAMRWMYLKQNPVNNMRFGFNLGEETRRKLMTLWNCFEFYKTYNNSSKFKIQNSKLKDENILDKWILSRLNQVIKDTTDKLDNFDPLRATQAIEDFWVNDLSLWYLRRSRQRIRENEEAQAVFAFVLLETAKLLAPLMPFLSEEMYQILKTKEMPESVHLCCWPEYDKALINEPLEKEMQNIRQLASQGLALRVAAGINVRQPLTCLKIKDQKLKTKNNLALFAILKEEVNVKEIIFDENIVKDLELDLTISEEMKEEGLVREIIRQVQTLRKKAGLAPEDKAALYFEGDFTLKEIILRNKKEILLTTRCVSLDESPEHLGKFIAQKELKINEKKLWLGLEN